VESDARTDWYIGDAVQRWDENSKCPTDRADHCSVRKVRSKGRMCSIGFRITKHARDKSRSVTALPFLILLELHNSYCCYFRGNKGMCCMH